MKPYVEPNGYRDEGWCPFHGPECWNECGQETAMLARVARDPAQLEKDRLQNNEYAVKYPHLYTHQPEVAS
jgi:hypothetical protein